ncbi:MAG TPA: pyroglutamyl-peptidase I [Thermotogota bacterium]|nr:pyroglutamyl-peptidase I [Thermotogota bacterium]
MHRLLVTGFEPFGKEKVNPSCDLIAALDGLQVENWQVMGRILPVSVEKNREGFGALLHEVQPHVLVSVGLSASARHITLERVALNVLDTRIPDNDGNHFRDEPIVPGGPAAYFSTLPIRPLLQRLHEKKVPAVLSNSAGTYLCNYVMYLGLHLSRHVLSPTTPGFAHTLSGFVHVPFLHEHVLDRSEFASLSFETMLRGVEEIIRGSISHFSQLSS